MLLSESDIFNENIELSVDFRQTGNGGSKNGNQQIHVIRRSAIIGRALNYVLHHMEDKHSSIRSTFILKETV